MSLNVAPPDLRRFPHHLPVQPVTSTFVYFELVITQQLCQLYNRPASLQHKALVITSTWYIHVLVSASGGL